MMDSRISALARAIIYGFMLLVVLSWLILGLWQFCELMAGLVV